MSYWSVLVLQSLGKSFIYFKYTQNKIRPQGRILHGLKLNYFLLDQRESRTYIDEPEDAHILQTSLLFATSTIAESPTNT